jgi:two-component system sensor kinase FixL
MTVRRESIENAGDQLLAALLGAAVDGIVVIDEEARIVSFSAGAQKMFGMAPEQVLGQNVTVLMPEPYHAEHDGYMTRYLETGEARIIGIGREVRARHGDGAVFPIDLSVGEAPMGDYSLFVGIMRDLRRRTSLENALKIERAHGRELEKSLAHVQRVSTLGEMTAGIAHEINQPLSAISTYADAGQRLAQQDEPNIEKIAYAMSCIAQQARRAGDVVHRMRDLAREADTPRAVRNINDVLRDLLVLIETEARDSDAPIRLTLANDEALPPVEIDSVQIQQVVINLVRNGLESMVLQSQAEKGIRIESRAHPEGVQVAIVDHGEGVEVDKMESIFLPFQTSKPNGMGIGLSICNTIIQRHNGRLWCEPNPDGGSRFSFTLPAAEESARAEQQ